MGFRAKTFGNDPSTSPPHRGGKDRAHTVSPPSRLAAMRNFAGFGWRAAKETEAVGVGRGGLGSETHTSTNTHKPPKSVEDVKRFPAARTLLHCTSVGGSHPFTARSFPSPWSGLSTFFFSRLLVCTIASQACRPGRGAPFHQARA